MPLAADNLLCTLACDPLAGRFGSQLGAATTACRGLCRAGFFCAPGSTSDTAGPCGAGVVTYCPAGTSAPVPVPVGWYSTPEVAPPTARSDITLCSPGEHCVAGVRANCSSGSYSGMPGRSECDACPAGTSFIETRRWWSSIFFECILLEEVDVAHPCIALWRLT